MFECRECGGKFTPMGGAFLDSAAEPPDETPDYDYPEPPSDPKVKPGVILVAGAVLLGAAVSLAGLVAALNSDSSPRKAMSAQAVAARPSESYRPVEVVTVNGAVELVTCYWQNVAKGDAKYTGKVVEFSTQGRIEKGPRGYLLTSLTGEVCPPFVGLQCLIRPECAGKLASAPPGATFHLRGICDGVQKDEVGYKPVVAVVDCEILAVKK